MRHTRTRQMLAHWMELMCETGVQTDATNRFIFPERSDVEPARVAPLLGDMFILDTQNAAPTYRLAGTRLCATMGREMKDEEFGSTFLGPDQEIAENWLWGMSADDHIVLLCSDGKNSEGQTVPLETLLMPLMHHGRRHHRVLGTTVALDAPYWLGSAPVIGQTIRSVRVLRPWDETPALSPDLVDTSATAPRRPRLGSPELIHHSDDVIPFAAEPQSTEKRRASLRVIEGGRT